MIKTVSTTTPGWYRVRVSASRRNTCPTQLYRARPQKTRTGSSRCEPRKARQSYMQTGADAAIGA